MLNLHNYFILRFMPVLNCTNVTTNIKASSMKSYFSLKTLDFKLNELKTTRHAIIDNS